MDESSFFQNLQMKGESRLSCLESVCEIADALLPRLQSLQNAQASFIGQGAEKPGRLSNVFTGGNHGKNIYQT